MDDETEVPANNNVFQLIQNVNVPEATRDISSDRLYYVKMRTGEEFVEAGFSVFTSHHLAIMREIDEQTAIPVLVIPLDLLEYCQLEEDDPEDVE